MVRRFSSKKTEFPSHYELELMIEIFFPQGRLGYICALVLVRFISMHELLSKI